MSKPLLSYGLSSVITITLLGHAQQPQDSQSSQREQARKYVQLVHLSRQPDGLHRAALTNGGTYVTQGDGPPWAEPASITDLVNSSEFVLIAKITDQQTHPINDGRGIATSYKFGIASILKGSLANPSRYSIDLPGGTYVYSDQSVATVEAPDFPRLRVGRTYLIFCSPSLDSPLALEPFQTQGIFELSEDGVTVHNNSTAPGDALKAKYDKEPQSQLLRDTKGAISKANNQ